VEKNHQIRKNNDKVIIFLYLCKKITIMSNGEIRDEISQEEGVSQETIDFNLRDAIIFSTILERKYN